MTNNRLGLRLSLSAIDSEFDQLQNELQQIRDMPDLLERATDQQMMAVLDRIKKRSNRIMAMAEAEQSRFAKHAQRHAVIAE